MNTRSTPPTSVPESEFAAATRRLSGHVSILNPTSEHDPLPVIPGYEVTGRLGRGGMGSVYSACCLRLKRPVALKWLELGGDDFPERLARFRIEAEAIAKLRHPNIVQIYDVGSHSGRPFFCLELAEGGSLAARLRSGPISATEAAVLVRDLASAVHFAHLNGVIHRDLKPHNVLLSAEGVAKLTDFGIAKLADEARTKTGDVMGTPAYMAPEQARGRVHEIGPATDVYGLGAILYEMLSGNPPFEGDSIDVIRKVCDEDPIPLTRMTRTNSRVPRDLAVITTKCLEKEPNRRYPSAQALVDDLERFLNGQTITARPVGTLGRCRRWVQRNPVIASLLGLLVGVFLGAFVLVTWLWRDADMARHEAELQGQLAHDKAEAAEDARRQIAFSQAEALLHLGIVECQRGTVDDGFERLLDALESAEKNQHSDLARLVRVNLRGFTSIRASEIALKGNRDWVWSIASSPDGNVIATASQDGHARVWDRHTGKLLADLPHDAQIEAAAFTPDGRWLLTGGRAPAAEEEQGLYGQFRIWNCANYEPVGEPYILPGKVIGFRFAPDQKTFLVINQMFAQTWTMAEDQTSPQIAGPPLGLEGFVFDAQFNKDGSAVLIGGMGAAFDEKKQHYVPAGGEVRLRDAHTAEERVPAIRHPGCVKSVAFHPDGSQFATGGLGGYAFSWDAVTGKQLAELPVPEIDYPGAEVQIRAVEYSPDGKIIAIAGGLLVSNDEGVPKLLGGAVRFWDTQFGRAVGTPLNHPKPVWSIAFSPDGRRLLTGCEDKHARLWSVYTCGQIGTDLHCGATVPEVGFTPDGTCALTAAAGGVEPARIWKLTPSTLEVLRLPSDTQWFTCSPDGSLVGVVHGGRTELLSLPEGKPVVELQADEPFVHMVRTISPDRKRVAVQVGSHQTRIFSAETGLPIGPGFSTGSLDWVRFRSDGAVLTAGNHENIQFWDPVTGQRLGDLVSSMWVGAVSKDGSICLTCDEALPKVYELNPPRLRCELPMRIRAATVGLSPDGKLAAAGHYNGMLQIHSAATGFPVGKVMAHPKTVLQIVFNEDASLVLTATLSGAVYVWDVESREQLGPPIQHGKIPSQIGFLPKRPGEPQRFYTMGPDPIIRSWPVPDPIQGSPAELRKRLEIDRLIRPLTN